MNFKKLLTATLAGAMLASCATITSVFADNELSNPVFYTPKVPEDYSINVDGKMDEIWTAVEPMAIDRMDEFVGAETNTTGTIRCMWDDTGFYCFVEVDKHGVDVYSTCIGEDIRANDDTVAFGWVNGGADQFWTHPGTVDYAYCGLIYGGDLDGNIEAYGWYGTYGTDSFKYKIRQTANDKYNVELFVSWVEATRSDVYGPAGVGEGSVIMFDAVIIDHNPDEPSALGYVAWSEYPYDSLGGSQNFGYLQLEDEADPANIKEITEDTTDDDVTGGDVTTGDVTDGDVTGGDATTGDVTGEKTADNKADKKDNAKKDNAPATLDAAAVVTAVSVLSLGALVITKKKHR